MSATEPDQHSQLPSAVDPHDLSDLTSTTHYSLSRAVHARKSEYTRPHRIRIKIGTWNVAGCPGTDKDLASWFVDGDGLDPKLDTSLGKLNLSENSIETSSANTHHKAPIDSDQPTSTSDKQTEPPGDTEQPTIRAVGGDKISLYVLGLQEIVNLNSVHQSLYGDPGAVAKWQDALEAALPSGYTLVASQQLVGLLLLIYASPEVAATISNESTVSTGTGLLGYMGNKGAVTSRLLLGETTRLVFSNCHLASGHDQTSLDRRCWDYNKIITHTTFAPISRSGVMEEENEKIGDGDFAFFFGDLNFRMDGLPGTDIRHLLTLHARGEYDITNTNRQLGEDGVFVLHDNDDQNSDGTSTPGMVSREASFDRNDSDESSEELPDPDEFVLNPHDDPASLQATLDSLLPHDQLRQVMKNKKAFHEGWREGPITFLPTYKYDVGTVGLFDTSEKKRAPSWCDRILFRTRKDRDKYIKEHQDEIDARNRDEDMKKRGIDEAADDESVLFDYDPTNDTGGDSQAPGVAGDVGYDYDEYDEDEADNSEQAVAHDGFVDEISLDLYTSHQRIMSSDHKPLVGIFTLTYEAVVPELKAKVHAEVAKELDRAENEGRPGITILVDGSESVAADRGTALDGSEGIDFGSVAFMRRASRSLTIANTGRVQAKLNFVEKPSIGDDEMPKPKWLEFKFRPPHNEFTESTDYSPQHEVSLDPGETVNAVIEVEVSDLKHLQALNEKPAAQLEDVLVLRVAEGRDHFIPIRASWRPSCFGRSLEELIRIPNGGITKFIEQHPKTGSIPYSLDVQTSSPTELFKLIEAIESLTERLIADENMVEDLNIPRDKAGWPFDRRTLQTNKDEDYATLRGHIMDTLENGGLILEALTADVPALKRLEIVSESLLLFLESMTDGIVSAPLWARIEQNLPQISNTKTLDDVEDIKTNILDMLSTAPYYNISFVFLTAMVAKVGSELLPLNKGEREVINTRKASGSMGRRSLSFRRNAGGGVDESAIQKRLAWERRAAEVFSTGICRTGALQGNGKEKERKVVDDKMRSVVEMFLRRDGA
ncbi:type II inositol-1,4,5-trisphosphate 5-phosphatase [Xylaria bambusicola]|uniref:type II inositol-1,4,5-trisphosphate 5-phosphatase n=1 Tax=Xylaria bambusicola TaxID=326684 RepID=UPI002008D3A7|nr:type II inositol-1,4,5-trisphosphate 5-phosphatase [Xylaria bambusicola]KAI0517448.1 type II inositol-1,4,5-trisphosphate 5-phosphatase [Xylaria bambusicola]